MTSLPGEGSTPVPVEAALSPQDVLKACSFFARSESLRSLELPLEYLLSGVVYLSGGRDKRGSPLLSITQPDDMPIEALMEMSTSDVIDMLSYFTSVPKDDSRAKGFSVLLSAESIHDFLLRTVVKALNAFQDTHAQLFNTVFFVSKTRNSSFIELACEGKEVNLPMVYLKKNEELLGYIDQSQLTKEFGGTLEYIHQDWVKFRLQVEPFICDCLGISKRLAASMQPLLEEQMPGSIDEAEKCIVQSKLKRQKTLDSLHIDELTAEGKTINQLMNSSFSKLQDNPEFTSTLVTVQKLVDQITNIKSRLDLLWNSYHLKLETNLRKHKFKKDTEQIVEWFEECADEFFVAQGEMGESLEVAEAMQLEVENFEQETRQVVSKTNALLDRGADLSKGDPEVRARFEKIQALIASFDERLSKQKKQLVESVRLHKLTQEAFDWCVRSVKICSDYDLLNTHPDNIEPLDIKQAFSDFLSRDDTFSSVQLQELSKLAEKASSPSTKENAIFACNRVTEMNERFIYYQMILDRLEQERRERTEQEASNKQQLLQHAVGVAEAVDVLVAAAAGDVQQVPPVTKGGPPSVTSGGGEAANPTTYTQTSSVDKVSYVANEDVDMALNLLEKAVSMASDLDTSTRTEEVSTSTEDVDLGVAKTKLDISGPAPIELTNESKGSLEEAREPETVENEDWTAQTKNARHRRHLMEELFATEETYIQSMEHICKHYLPVMEDGRDIPVPLRGKKDAIFVNIPELIKFNKSKILPKLQECRKCPIKLGQVFLEEEESFLHYSTYFKAMPYQSKLMVDAGSQFFASTQQAISDSFPLMSYLIKPFQRVAKYKLFLDDMIKHFVKSDLNGKLKECYDHLKESQKMIDFILRHGNDLLALDLLTGFQVNPSNHGMLLRQGELIVVDKNKHKRVVFLFENTIVFAKSRKLVSSDPHSPDTFEFKTEYKTRDLSLRENIVDHPTRFELRSKQKVVIMLQAPTEGDKNQWVEEIRELFFSHMLQMKDTLLETYHATPLSSVKESLVNPLARGSYYGHTMRRTVSMRPNRELLKQWGVGAQGARPYSTQSGDLSFGGQSGDLSFTGVRPASGISQDWHSNGFFSNRSSLVSTTTAPGGVEGSGPVHETLASDHQEDYSQDPEKTVTSASRVAATNASCEEGKADSQCTTSSAEGNNMGSSQETDVDDEGYMIAVVTPM